MSVRLSAKSFSDSDEIWYVGRGRWVMQDGFGGPVVSSKRIVAIYDIVIALGGRIMNGGNVKS